MASSTLELVEKLKAQLAESREDLFRKDRLHESTEAKGTPKDLSTLIAGSDSESFSDLRERSPIEYQEEMASMKQEMTAKMHSLASNTRQLSQQLLREREDRLAFQQEVCQRLDDLVQNELHQRPKAHADLLESSVVALREDLEHLSGQFLLLQQELKASFDSMAMQLGAVVSWVQEKLETQPFTKDGMCLSPIMEDQESPGEPDVIPKEPGPEQVTAVDLQMRDGKMFQVLRNIADEMPAIVKQMAEKTQVLVTRVDHEHAERLAREAHVEEALSTLSRKVEDALSAAGRGWLVDDRDDRDATRPGLPVNRPRTAAPVLFAFAFPQALKLQELLEKGASTKLKLPPLLDVDVFPGFCLLHLAAQGGERCEQALEALLKTRCDPNGMSAQGAPPLGQCLTGRAVDLLVQYRADVNRAGSMVAASPLDACCYRQVAPSVIQRLIEHGAYVSNEQGRCISPLCMLVFHAHGNPLWRETADLLIDAEADPNNKMIMTGALHMAQVISRCWMASRWMATSKEPPMLFKIICNGDTTPLGLAAILGSETMVEYLLTKGAKVHIKNRRSQTVINLASTSQVRELLRHHLFRMRDMMGGATFDSEAERTTVSELSDRQGEPSDRGVVCYHDRGIMSMVI